MYSLGGQDGSLIRLNAGSKEFDKGVYDCWIPGDSSRYRVSYRLPSCTFRAIIR
jgi:hypothetical protein